MLWLSIAGGVFLAWLILVFLFTPGINYRLSERTSIHEPDFLYTLQSTCQAALHHGNSVTVFTNGVSFYPAMLEAIGQATRSINMELYIFQPGKIADQFGARMPGKNMARRISFLIGTDGKIAHVTDNPAADVHLNEMKDAVANLAKK